MKVQCVLCDVIEEIEQDSPLAKKLRNHPTTTYMCRPCSHRIRINTEQRKLEGRLKKPTFHKENDGW